MPTQIHTHCTDLNSPTLLSESLQCTNDSHGVKTLCWYSRCHCILVKICIHRSRHAASYQSSHPFTVHNGKETSSKVHLLSTDYFRKEVQFFCCSIHCINLHQSSIKLHQSRLCFQTINSSCTRTLQKNSIDKVFHFLVRKPNYLKCRPLGMTLRTPVGQDNKAPPLMDEDEPQSGKSKTEELSTM